MRRNRAAAVTLTGCEKTIVACRKPNGPQSWTTDECPAGCSKRPFSKAAADESTGGVASGYVEDAFEARTMLADFFSILQAWVFVSDRQLG